MVVVVHCSFIKTSVTSQRCAAYDYKEGWKGDQSMEMKQQKTKTNQ